MCIRDRRCLVPCANYPEFWKLYLAHLNTKGDKDAAEAVAKRAISHLKRDPEIFAVVAHMKEVEGDVQGARDNFTKVTSEVTPGLVEGVINLANFERRQGDTAAVKQVYEAGLQSVKDSKGRAFVAMHYARYLAVCLGDAAQCREVYKAGAAASPDCVQLWEAWMQWEATQTGAGQEAVDAIIGSVAQEHSLSAGNKQVLWEWYLEYLADFGASVANLKESEEKFRAQFGNAASSSRKRGLEAAAPDGAAKQARSQDPAAAAWQAQQQQQQQIMMQQQQQQMLMMQQQQQAAAAAAVSAAPPVGQTDTPEAESCGDFKRGMCSRARCKFSHQ
eukprot:TRINITY_DN9138_c0_g1_i2.p1 TRINITY_DN9138_c0_g1~~TRINITY_DN9138_c0_g1_i2.p1  ORF type:complete len:332 (-),score=94.63 TRINITY_DN9138_c0_g1_i2:227-1222(-)